MIMLLYRTAASYYIDEKTGDTSWDRFMKSEGPVSMALVCFLSLSQSFIYFKLAQLVYILPEQYKWNLVAAQAWAGIFITLLFLMMEAIWVVFLHFYDP